MIKHIYIKIYVNCRMQLFWAYTTFQTSVWKMEFRLVRPICFSRVREISSFYVNNSLLFIISSVACYPRLAISHISIS